MTGKAAGGAKGSPLRQRMIDQMHIANLAASTQTAYLFEVERMAKHYGASPADLDAEQVRDFVLTLIDRGLSPSSTNSTLSALRFLYVETLGCPERVAGGAQSKAARPVTAIHMTEQEVERLILATPDLQHPAAFVTAYGAGLRVSETVTVKIGRHQGGQEVPAHPVRQGRYREDGPAARRGHPLPAQLLQEHLAAAGKLAILRRFARRAHLGGVPAPCLQEGPRAGLASPPATASTACVIRPRPICLSAVATSR